jgi:hypothetical protein
LRNSELDRKHHGERLADDFGHSGFDDPDLFIYGKWI